MANLEADPKFTDLGLGEETLKVLESVGYETPSPIQSAFIPIAVKGGDCIGQARTGTGKTAAFVLPMLERIDFSQQCVQALVLTPTRELSEQVAREAARLSANHHCRTACLVGGRPIRQQMNDLQRGTHIAIGTPGRVLDLIGRGVLMLDKLRIVVLDEADRMLDIGFRPDIEKILRQCPEQRQSLLLSATLPPPVERLARRYMQDPQVVDMSESGVAVESIRQFYITVDHNKKREVLRKILLRERPKQVLVFTRTKRGAEHLYQKFAHKLPNVAHLHGDLPQRKRDSVMQKFRDGKVRLLIATDVMGRGIDVSGISHIINYDIPEFCDDYVHRIGRTGRLSSDEEGVAITFVTPDQGEELTRVEIRVNSLLERYPLSDADEYHSSERRGNDSEKAKSKSTELSVA